MAANIKNLICILFTLFFNACTVVYRVDSHTHTTLSFNERKITEDEAKIKFIILHYTALNDERSTRALTKNNVSSHYLVLRKNNSPVYSIVPDEKRAWHAGISSFAGYDGLNDTSIGIEISNLGYKKLSKRQIAKIKNGVVKRRLFSSYKDSQIFKIGMLLQELTSKYDINPKHILAHSDIAPTRKTDPGPKFPWKELYDEYGVGAWYDIEDFNEFNSKTLFESYSIIDLKNELRQYGYTINSTPEWDIESIKIVSAFQLHFRQNKVTGVFDLETFAILKALNKKYK